MVNPLISFVVATRNVADVLAVCLRSLAGQPFTDYSVVIQDALSTDATSSCVDSFRGILPAVHFCSEADDGICDAWNKALQLAAGEWILFLGADDFLLPDVLPRLASFLKALPQHVEFVASPAVVACEHGGFCNTLQPSRYPQRSLRDGMCFPHQGLLHRKSVFSRVRFDTSLRIVGDYDLVCRAISDDNVTYYDMPVAAMRLGGVSTVRSHALLMYRECATVSRRFSSRGPSLRLYARMGRAVFLSAVERVLGKAAADHCADQVRATLGKTPLWADSSNKALARYPVTSSSLCSLLVATVGRTAPLERLLASLGQAGSDIEVLIADQNPPGTLDDILRRYGASLNIRHVRVPHNGVSRARNTLLPLARGDIIAFPDDDCWYAPGAVEAVRDLFARYPHAQGVIAGWSDEATLGVRNRRVAPVGRFSAFSRGETYTQFYRKEAISGICFDVELGPGNGLPYGCGEDTDFLLQVLGTGAPVVRTREVLVHHATPDFSDPRLPAKAYAYALGRMRLLQKHGFPLWFRLGNVLYPLLRLAFESPKAWRYRVSMMAGRLKGFFGSV